MALGGNSGMESVIVLTNLLHAQLAATNYRPPSRHTLDNLFQRYQDQRLPRMKHILEFSRLITRTQAWDTWLLKMISIWVLPYLPKRKLADDLGEIIRKAPMLDFVELGDWQDGRLEWEDMKSTSLAEASEMEKDGFLGTLRGTKGVLLGLSLDMTAARVKHLLGNVSSKKDMRRCIVLYLLNNEIVILSSQVELEKLTKEEGATTFDSSMERDFVVQAVPQGFGFMDISDTGGRMSSVSISQ
ncbi:MAG: hypothetical protein Q9219_004842 [cf. Caloplaca sp. 3 TL-2023]